jgi:methionine synthase I (cobalamin-dependent)
VLFIHTFQWDDVNEAAGKLANEVAKEGPYALSAGSLCETGQAFRSGEVPKDVIQQKFKKQVDIFVKNDVDLLIAEVMNKD